eukprot:gene24665-10291_t
MGVLTEQDGERRSRLDAATAKRTITGITAFWEEIVQMYSEPAVSAIKIHCSRGSDVQQADSKPIATVVNNGIWGKATGKHSKGEFQFVSSATFCRFELNFPLSRRLKSKISNNISDNVTQLGHRDSSVSGFSWRMANGADPANMKKPKHVKRKKNKAAGPLRLSVIHVHCQPKKKDKAAGPLRLSDSHVYCQTKSGDASVVKLPCPVEDCPQNEDEGDLSSHVCASGAPLHQFDVWWSPEGFAGIDASTCGGLLGALLEWMRGCVQPRPGRAVPFGRGPPLDS